MNITPSSKTLMVVSVVLAIIVGSFWLPFGFKDPDTQEFWWLQAYIDGWRSERFGVHEVAHPLLPTLRLESQMINRPALLSATFLAYTITPNSFVGYHLLHWSVLFLRGIFLFLIARRLLPDRLEFAFLFSLLSLIYPADTGVLNLRAYGIQLSLFAFVLAVYALVKYWDTPRVSFLVVMFFAQLLCLGIYEVTYSLILVIPLILLYLEHRLSRRVVYMSMLWYAIPMLTLTYRGIVSVQMPDNLYSHLLAQRPALTDLPRYFVEAYSYSVLGTWKDSVMRLAEAPPSQISIALVQAFCSFAVCWYLRKQSVQIEPQQSTPRRYLIIAFIGLVAMGLAIVPYALSDRIVYDKFRVYLLASMGASLFVVGGVFGISHLTPKRTGQFPPIVSSAALAFLIYLSSISGFCYFGSMHELSVREQTFLYQIISQAPALKDTTLIVVVPSEEELDLNIPPFQKRPSALLSSALAYLYNQHDLFEGGIICGSATECTFQTENLLIHTPETGSNVLYPYKRMIIFRASSYSNVQLVKSLSEIGEGVPEDTSYNPGQLIEDTDNLPPRVYTVLVAAAK